MMDTLRDCKGCTLCCKVIGVHGVDKPPQTWCTHCAVGEGCTIYHQRPQDCRFFECMWVEEGSALPEHWLPAHSHMVLCADMVGPRIEVHVDADHLEAWRQEPYYSELRAWSENAIPNGGSIMVYLPERTIVILPHKHVDLGPLDDDAQIVYVRRWTADGLMPDVELLSPEDPRFERE